LLPLTGDDSDREAEEEEVGMAIVISGKPYGLGAIIALVVLLLCVVLAVIGKALSPFLVLVLIALLALAILL
jgi:hypothetical protein